MHLLDSATMEIKAPDTLSNPALDLQEWFLGPPLALKASLSDPDTLTYDEAMSDEPNLSKWMAAAAKEIASLEKNKTWIETEISNAKSRILPGTWVFKRKRTPDGVISKYKARYCVRGDLEEGEPETFAPVVAWSSVRLFTILALTLNWDTSSIDFSNAFVQAKLETPVWIHLPRGFQSPRGKSTCLQLVKSLYGLSVAPRLWFEHVLEAFTDQGFKQSTLDPCFCSRTPSWSQVARFNHSPKKSHATAIKTIIRYLHRTADKGTIVRPTGDLSIDCYVDADFAGLHGRDPDYEPSSAKSRTDTSLRLADVQFWKSKLQTEISLSTLESEYSALSASMRTLLPPDRSSVK
ncbi:hypothetical protein MHU86_3701 [Fragilaria crotonensis]|nr:hypothetical protein MHU86_3701 [Fragilaria crotonensis]